MTAGHVTPTLLAALAVAAVAAPVTLADSACPDADLAPTADDGAQVAAATLCAINEQRTQAGLVALRREPHLDRSAAYHADDMAFFRYFAHQRPGGPTLLDRIKATGYFAHAIGGTYTENLADAPDGGDSAGAVVTAWMGSEDHRTNILWPSFRDAGIAIESVPADEAFYMDRPSVLFVVDFGRRYVRSRTVCAKRRRRTTHRRHASTRRPHRVCTRHTSRRKHR